MNMEKIRLAYDVPAEDKKSYDIEAWCLPHGRFHGRGLQIGTAHLSLMEKEPQSLPLLIASHLCKENGKGH